MDQPDFRALCAELVTVFKDENTYTQRIEILERARTALVTLPPEPFVVRFYASDHYPSIKGNGFDGLQVGEDRKEAEEFIGWVNKHCALATPPPEPPTVMEIFTLIDEIDEARLGQIDLVRAALERWGK